QRSLRFSLPNNQRTPLLANVLSLFPIDGPIAKRVADEPHELQGCFCRYRLIQYDQRGIRIRRESAGGNQIAISRILRLANLNREISIEILTLQALCESLAKSSGLRR